jgi:predicted nucleic acid-binding protein
VRPIARLNTIFLDTGYIIALEAADDQYHEMALRHWRDLKKTFPKLVTTTYVFDEIVTFFNTRNQHSKAVELGNRLINSPSVRLIHIVEMLFDEAWQYFIQHEDKSYSLTDCLSFIVMKRFEIQTALTFDRHFVQAGFQKMPELP